MTGPRELAQDLIQDTFVQLWSVVHMFDPKRRTLKAWLYKMALNLVHTEMRRKFHGQKFEPLDDQWIHKSEERKAEKSHGPTGPSQQKIPAYFPFAIDNIQSERTARTRGEIVSSIEAYSDIAPEDAL